MITLRLDPKLEQTINKIAHQMEISKSELIRTSIIEFIAKLDKPSPWKLGNEVFGKYASGVDNLSSDRKSLVKEKIKAKR
ncbi:MAG: CopG family transcriptional regulator [Methylococcales bacterium]|nr:CopG family transcriptional regulator [Methylococcales bacterium]